MWSGTTEDIRVKFKRMTKKTPWDLQVSKVLMAQR